MVVIIIENRSGIKMKREKKKKLITGIVNNTLHNTLDSTLDLIIELL
jgi:hypothetical protein